MPWTASCIHVANSVCLLLYIFASILIMFWKAILYLTIAQQLTRRNWWYFSDILKKIILKFVMLNESLEILQWKWNSQLGRRKQVGALSWLVIVTFLSMLQLSDFFLFFYFLILLHVVRLLSARTSEKENRNVNRKNSFG